MCDTTKEVRSHLGAYFRVLSLTLCRPLRPGRLPAAVHQDFREGERGRRPAAADHSPGAGGFGSVQDRPPGAGTGGCGPALCTGESTSCLT